ncbi:glycosyl transferase [Streptomyces sp. CB02923]|uniref:glycosyltransferase family 4 protein n=1 Tax=Streptomyces sp. CB02923 TaxID=1718985 RepID=UPI00093CA452|nr:glycosyltransferase family 4 protein [Streptomyces sp. CB02923]OKI06211.1 glycosyl transferase [Streptomyces sp. CB02923]
MHMVFLIHNAYGIGGTIRATYNLASVLAEQHDVEIASVFRHRDVPVMDVPAKVRLTHLVDLRAASADFEGDDPRHAEPAGIFPRADGRHRQYSRLTDSRIGSYLSRSEADVIVGTRPGLNTHIARQARAVGIRVGQEHLTFSGHGFRLRHEIRHRYQLLDAITTVSESDARSYRQLHLPGVRVEAIPNSVPRVSGEPADGSGKVIVAAGRLIPLKRYEILIKAFAEVAEAHPDWHLRIFGEGDTTGNERESLTSLIGELDLSRKVHLMGKVDPLEPEWIKGSIAASASDRESFGMTIVEAMRCGLPVVSTDCPVGPREIIEDGVDGYLVPTGHVGGMAAALLELVGDDRLRRRMGEAALKNSARFDPSLIAERHQDLYQDLLRRGPGRRSVGFRRKAGFQARTRAIDTAHAVRSMTRAVASKLGAP